VEILRVKELIIFTGDGCAGRRFVKILGQLSCMCIRGMQACEQQDVEPAL